VLLVVIAVIAFLLYTNFNQLLSAALQRSFESNVISNVYELKFEKLRVNIFDGDISIYNVILQPRKKPLQNYPYINSSLNLKTEMLQLVNVKLSELLKFDRLNLDRIAIIRPEIELDLNGKIPVLFPFIDSTGVAASDTGFQKRAIIAFLLRKFQIIDANIKVQNSYLKHDFIIAALDVSLDNLSLSQQFGRDLISCKDFELLIGSFQGELHQSTIEHVSFKDYKLKLDSLRVHKTLDTVIYNFQDFTLGLLELNLLTSDSIYHISMEAFSLSYLEKSIKLRNVKFKPNLSDRELQKRFPYQNTQFSGDVEIIDFLDVNFDTLIYHNTIHIDKMVVDKITASIYKDKTKPVDPERLPQYPGQQLKAIPMPLYINDLEASNVSITNRERLPGGSVAKVNVTRMSVTANNITNTSDSSQLSVKAEAYIEDKAYFKAAVAFDYQKPMFRINGSIGKFNLPDLNSIIQSYTPAKINTGKVDGIAFSGIVNRTNASGNLTFLYHDLNIDLQLQEQAKWKSTLGAFAANTYLRASNPLMDGQPPRVVEYEVDRDMHKGFINIILKSLFMGLKETMSPSKENRKAFQETRREWKQKKKDN